MSEKDFVGVIATVALSLFILGIPFYKNHVESCYKDKNSEIFLWVFWGLTIATLVGGSIFDLFKYHIGG